MPSNDILVLTNPFLFDDLYMEPHYRSLDLGLLYVVRYLRDNGIDLDLFNPFDLAAVFPGEQFRMEYTENREIALHYDRDRYLEYFRDYLMRSTYRIILLPVYYNVHYANTIKSLLLVRKYAPRDTVLIIGGQLADSMPHAFLKKEFEPIVQVVGEGERTTLDLVQRILDGQEFSDVRGVARLDGNVIVGNPPDEVETEIDQFGTPFFMEDAGLGAMDRMQDLFFQFAEENALSVRYAWRMSEVVLTSRGCPYRCTFCSESAREGKLRFHSKEYILETVRNLHEDRNVTFIHFADAIFFLHPEIQAILKGLKHISVEYAIQTRGDTFLQAQQKYPDLLDLLKGSGCIRIAMGVEAFDQDVLDALQKQERAVDIENAAFRIMESGISLFLTFISGAPGQTMVSLEETVLKCRERFSSPDVIISFFPMTILPGTLLFQQARESGLIRRENSIDANSVEYYYIDPDTDFSNREIFLRAARWANYMVSEPAQHFVPLQVYLDDLDEMLPFFGELKELIREWDISILKVEKMHERCIDCTLLSGKQRVSLSLMKDASDKPAFIRVSGFRIVFTGSDAINRNQEEMIRKFSDIIGIIAGNYSIERMLAPVPF